MPGRSVYTHDDVVRLDRQLDRVVVDADELLDLLRAGERARDRSSCEPSDRAPRRIVITLRYASLIGLDDQAHLDAALLGEQRRVDVRDVLAHDVREEALERRELVAR